MSLTVIYAIAVGVSIPLAIMFFFLAEEYGAVPGVIGTVLIAVAVGAFIAGVESYNANVAESKRQAEIDCIERGHKVVNFNGLELCMTTDSEIIGKI